MCFCKFVFLFLNLCVLGCPKTSVFLVFEVSMYNSLFLSLSLSISLSVTLTHSLALYPPPCTYIQYLNVCGQAARETLFLKSSFSRTMRVGKAKGDSIMIDQDSAIPSQIGVNACGCGCRCGCAGEGGTFISCVSYLTKREIGTRTHSLTHTNTQTYIVDIHKKEFARAFLGSQVIITPEKL